MRQNRVNSHYRRIATDNNRRNRTHGPVQPTNPGHKAGSACLRVGFSTRLQRARPRVDNIPNRGTWPVGKLRNPVPTFSMNRRCRPPLPTQGPTLPSHTHSMYAFHPMSWEYPSESCPRCRYSWRGLPRNGLCPECGFAYDSGMQVWHPTIRPWYQRGMRHVIKRVAACFPVDYLRFMAISTLFLLITAFTKSPLLSWAEVPRFLRIMCLLGGLFWLIRIIWIFVTAIPRTPRKRVCVRQSGVCLCDDHDVRDIPWNALFEVTFERRTVVFDVHRGQGAAEYVSWIADEDSFPELQELILRLRDAAGGPTPREDVQ